jgi:hypothetical protein
MSRISTKRSWPIRAKLIGTFDLVHRFETTLWRQAAQLLFLLQATPRR